MKTKLTLTPENLTLDEINQRFATDDAAREYLESILWPHGPVCPHCKNADSKTIWKIAANAKKKIRAGLYRCAECNKEFTVTIDTIFEDSHIPLRKWLIAWYMICSSKKGVSSLQLQRMLNLGSYRTALFMTHRIRYGLHDPAFNTKLDGTVEVDETYVGGKQRGVGSGSKLHKTPVVALVQRGGKVRSHVTHRVSAYNLKKAVHDNVELGSKVMTDDNASYIGLRGDYDHQSVNHSVGEYVRDEAHTNTAEGFFSLLKRGIVGTFHSISREHLPLYLAEFDHRWDYRKVTDGERTVAGLKKVKGKRLTYKFVD
jgi:transposase-like protein